MRTSGQGMRTVAEHSREQVEEEDQGQGCSGTRAPFAREASGMPGAPFSPQAERARRIAAAARARTARIRAAGSAVGGQAAPGAGGDGGGAAERDAGAAGPAPEPDTNSRADEPEVAEPLTRAPGLSEVPEPARFDVEGNAPPSDGGGGLGRSEPGEATAAPVILEVDVPYTPPKTRQEPTPRARDSLAGSLFARTRQAIEAERREAEAGRAWSHVLRTPEEIGAAQESRLGRLLRRLVGFGRAAPVSAKTPPAGGTIDVPRPPSGTVGRRPSRAASGGGRHGVAFVTALATGALVTSLLFGGLLGLPQAALTSKWPSWPFALEEREAVSGQEEVAVAGPPEEAGQGGPELAADPEAEDASNAMTVAARAARSEPAVSDMVAIAGSPPDAARQYYRLGHRLHARGDFRGAAEMYRQAAALAPDDAATFYDWARALEMLGERDAAIAKYRTALELAPDSPAGADARTRLAELEGR